MNEFDGRTQELINVENLRNYAINYKNINKTLESEKGVLIEQEHTLSAQNDKIESYLKALQNNFDLEKKRLLQRCNDSDAELKELKKKFKDVNEEASRYQSALGKATNLRWGDDDADQLQQTISELQNTLSEFTNVKAKDTIFNEEVDKLLTNYVCTTVFNIKTGKAILSAVLQRLILDISFKEITEYLKNSNLSADKNDNLESDVNNNMKLLVGMVESLAKKRQGDDDISNITPVKVRQQVYAVLGTRGFCKENHTFIEALSDKIIDNVKHYRQIKPNETNQIKTTTTNLVKDIAHLYLRIYAQQPIPSLEFFESGTPIRKGLMEGGWDENDAKNLEVELCSFPLVYIKDGDSKKVLYKAQVIARQKSKTNIFSH